MSHRYYETTLRHAAVTAEGKPCEILERITFERDAQADGSYAGEGREVNRRFDLRTGERVRHLGGDDFLLDLTEEPIRRLTATA
jgi:hypothetical protein